MHASCDVRFASAFNRADQNCELRHIIATFQLRNGLDLLYQTEDKGEKLVWWTCSHKHLGLVKTRPISWDEDYIDDSQLWTRRKTNRADCKEAGSEIDTSVRRLASR